MRRVHFSTIETLYKLKRLTQRQFAEAINESAQTVNNWKRRENVPPEKAPKIAEYFDISIDELFDGASQHKKPKKADEPSKSEDLLEKAFELMAELEALDNPERERFDKAMTAHHKLRAVISGKQQGK
jgi:transcriptional regulator with XRE-family HTH domain